MKRQFLLMTMACMMLLVACNKNNGENQGEAVFTATTEHQGGRTSLDPNNGNINWTAGDQIVIANANDETATFSLRSGEGTTEGGFGTADDFNTVGPFVAAYPETATIANDVVTFNLPATQAIGETGTFANGANPMVACSDDKNLQFKNLCGGLGIRLKGVGAHVSAVRITSKNTSEKLWGTFEVSNCAANEPTLTEASGNQGTNVITLTCDVTLTTAATTFFVMLPPGTLANGFTMEVLDGNEVLATNETDSEVALVERNSVKLLNEILIDVELNGNIEIPTGMEPSDIIITNFGEDAIPDENGDFAIGYSKMLTARNAGNGKIIYISNLSVDYDIAKGDRQQNHELSAKETALHYALCLIPFGTYQSKDATFNSMKDALYELACVKNLETAIENTVNQYGYLKTDEIGTELNAVWEYLKADLLDRFFEDGKSVSSEQPVIVGKITLTEDNVRVSTIPNLPVSRYRGVRLDINENGTHFNSSANTWTLAMTGYSDNGVYIGVNKGSLGDNGQAYPSNERIHYFLPPMNVGKFMGTFTSFSGIRAYFQDTWSLFFEEGFGFDDMTWDMAKLDGITLELGRNDNVIMLMSPKDSQETAVINVVYASLQVVGFALDKVLDTHGIDAFFTSLLNDAEFVSSVTANFGGGLGNFTSIAQDVLERLADFLLVQGISLLDGMDLDKALDYISDNAARAVLELAGNELGTIASWGLFDTFGLLVEAEYNDDLPTVSIESYEVLSSSQASVVAKLESIGTISVMEIGVCYSPTSLIPTVNDLCSSHLSPSVTGSYPCQLNGLQANKTYYARAYAKCPLGVVVYSPHVVSFNTMPEGSQTFTIITTTNPTNSGTVTGGGTYNQGQSCTVTATANSGYTFANWTENGNVVSIDANYTFIVTGNRTLVANFTSNGGGGTPTDGVLNGLFTVNSSGEKVHFSQGNLQYQASSNTWRFAEHQWDYIGTQTPDANGLSGGTVSGSDNANISSSYNGWVDLFGWGTSGWNCGNTYFRPWDSDESDGSLYGPPGHYNLTGSYVHSDWGVHNAISNGGNQTGFWRTLTSSEWDYVFNIRNTSCGIRFAKAQVSGVNGVILLPDDWSSSYYSLSDTNSSDSDYTNVISSSAWLNILQAHGAVFLPAAGFRDGSLVRWVTYAGCYWSASYNDMWSEWKHAEFLLFDTYRLFAGDGSYGPRCYGQSVRLVRSARQN